MDPEELEVLLQMQDDMALELAQQQLEDWLSIESAHLEAQIPESVSNLKVLSRFLYINYV